MNIREIATIPNATTFGRAALIPKMFKMMRENPRGAWPVAGAVALSDNLDGFMARLGDKHPTLAKLGFRGSELGRKADPAIDVAYTSSMVVAGMMNRSIPRSIAMLSLAQKAAKSGITLAAEKKGVELHVTKAGKYTEFGTNTGFGLMFAAESVDNPVAKRAVRAAGGILALASITGASFVALDYARTAGLLPHSSQPPESMPPVEIVETTARLTD